MLYERWRQTLRSPEPGKIKPTELARKIIRPQDPKDRLTGLREAVMNAPVISDVYKKYRGENLPDLEFLTHTLEDTFSIPQDEVERFIQVFRTTLTNAELLEDVGNGKYRVLDVTAPAVAGTQRRQMHEQNRRPACPQAHRRR